MTIGSSQSCVLCASNTVTEYYQDSFGIYYHCGTCDLVFRDRETLLSPEDEHNRYRLHQEPTEESGYLNYLAPFFELVEEKKFSIGRSLDFGCGRFSFLKRILESKGHAVEEYDLYFRPDKSVLEKKYDSIFLLEVAEHFQDPRTEFSRLNDLVARPGSFFIHTLLRPENFEKFKTWHYRRDPTHVQFFTRVTLEWLCKTYNWRDLIVRGDRAICIATGTDAMF